MSETNTNATDSRGRSGAGGRRPRARFDKANATMLLLTVSLGLAGGTSARVLRQAHEDAVVAAARAGQLAALRGALGTTGNASATGGPIATAPRPPANSTIWLPQRRYGARASTRGS